MKWHQEVPMFWWPARVQWKRLLTDAACSVMTPRHWRRCSNRAYGFLSLSGTGTLLVSFYEILVRSLPQNEALFLLVQVDQQYIFHCYIWNSTYCSFLEIFFKCKRNMAKRGGRERKSLLRRTLSFAMIGFFVLVWFFFQVRIYVFSFNSKMEWSKLNHKASLSSHAFLLLKIWCKIW